MTTADPDAVGLVQPPASDRTPGSSVRSVGLAGMVWDDLRWAFRRPYGWLLGIGVNLLLSLGYLVIVPLRGGHHRDWAILVGTYFAVFILADVTTTNVLGVDVERTRLRLLRHVSLIRILLVKNLALLVLVGGPTLLATALITLHDEANYRLELTLPGVLYPTLTWLGVGNLISVLLPYWPVPLVTRWHQRRRLGLTARWLICLGLPYALCSVVEPMRALPRVLGQAVHLPSTAGVRGIELLAMGLLAWGLLTGLAVTTARRRGIRFDDLR